jgi:hypothetical protein
MSEQYNHGKNRDGFPLGISNIWQGKSLFGLVWKWSNRCGEGEENTFDAAVTAAEAALSQTTTSMATIASSSGAIR